MNPQRCISSWRARSTRLLAQIQQIQQAARALPPGQRPERPRWPMIVLRTPKGWTGPKTVDGKQVEGSWRSHQVPIAEFKTEGHVQQLEDWLKSYRPHELFDEHGRLRDELAALAPTWPPAHGRQPARQRRCTAAAAVDAVHSRACRGGARARRRRCRIDTRAGRLPARRDEAQRGQAQLPPLRAGRDRIEPACRMSTRCRASSGWPRS